PDQYRLGVRFVKTDLAASVDRRRDSAAAPAARQGARRPAVSGRGPGYPPGRPPGQRAIPIYAAIRRFGDVTEMDAASGAAARTQCGAGRCQLRSAAART